MECIFDVTCRSKQEIYVTVQLPLKLYAKVDIRVGRHSDKCDLLYDFAGSFGEEVALTQRSTLQKKALRQDYKLINVTLELDCVG